MGYFTYPISMQVLSFVGLLERSALNLSRNIKREIRRLKKTSTACKRLSSLTIETCNVLYPLPL